MANRDLASARDSEDHERVVVDLNADDPDKAVTRIPVRQAVSEKREERNDPDLENRLNRKAFNKRFTRIQRSFDQQLADRDALHQRELSERDKRIAALEVNRTPASGGDDAAHEARIDKLTKELEAAAESGESGKVARLTAQITRAEAEFWAKKEAAVRGTSARKEEPAPRAAAQPRNAMPNKGKTPQANKWLRDNEDWLHDDDYRVERAAALVIDEDLTEEGFEADTEEYFEEMSKRLVTKFPKLDVVGVPKARKGKKAVETEDELEDDDDGKEDDEDEEEEYRPTHRRRSAVPQVEDRGTPSQRILNRRGKTHLTKEQAQTMLAVGMDPKNNKQVLTYLRENQQIEE